MIIFHEGLPGSGKTYEAVVKHLIPTLQQGRFVYAFIEGLDHQRIAEVSGMSVDLVRNLLVVVEREQVLELHKNVPDNAFVVIDEAQNFYPTGKLRLETDIMRFVAEHRHRGIDVLMMGQDIRDLHALWKRRVDQKVTFTKMDMMGMSSKYRWILFKATSGESFQEINRGMSSYDPKYFGTYKSHVHGGINTEMYKDKRANIWKSNYFVLGAIAVVVMFSYGYYGYKSFFTSHRAEGNRDVSASVSSNAKVKNEAVKTNVSAPVEYDLIADYLKRGYRPRLGSVFQAADKMSVSVEFRDSSLRVQDRMNSVTLSVLGWRMLVYGLDLAVLIKPGQPTIYLTPWPLDATGRVSEQNINQIREEGKKEDFRGSKT